MAANDTTKMMFWPGSYTISKNFRVGDTPIRIIGKVPVGAKVIVWRIYENTGDECEYSPDPLPVLCCDSCDTLSLFNVPYADCHTGFLVQSEILINSSGLYYLEYCCPEEEVIVPDECLANCVGMTGVLNVVEVTVPNILDADPATFVPSDFSLFIAGVSAESITSSGDGTNVTLTITFPAGTDATGDLMSYAPLDPEMRLAFTTGCVLGDFSNYTITSGCPDEDCVACVVTSVDSTDDPKVLEVMFDCDQMPDVDSANLIDFSVDEGDPPFADGGNASPRIILNPISIDYSQAGMLTLTFEFNVSVADELLYAASDANRLSFDGGCEVADFNGSINYPATNCILLDVSNYTVASNRPWYPGLWAFTTITIDTTDSPDVGSAVLTDFTMPNGVGGFSSPVAINYAVAGEVELAFDAQTISDGNLIYTATSPRLGFGGVCGVADFSEYSELNPVLLADDVQPRGPDQDPPCLVIPDGVYVWRREEYIKAGDYS